MLTGIDPLLTGELLRHLDEMGHGDALVLADAHFPASSVGARHVLTMPAVPTPALMRAIRTVIPLDEHVAAPLQLMRSADGAELPVQQELARAAGCTPAYVDRFAFYDLAARAYLVVRCGEVRTYGNAWLSKGVVSADGSAIRMRCRAQSRLEGP